MEDPKDKRIRELEAQVAKYQERLEIDHVYVAEVVGRENNEEIYDMVRKEVPMEQRDTYPDAVSCRDSTIEMLDKYIEEIEPAFIAAQEFLQFVLAKYKIPARENITCQYVLKLYDTLDATGRIDLPDVDDEWYIKNYKTVQLHPEVDEAISEIVKSATENESE